MEPVKSKWNLDKNLFFNDLQSVLSEVQDWSAASIEAAFKEKFEIYEAIEIRESERVLYLMQKH